MADDDLKIVGSFDAGPLVEGIQKAANAVKEASSQMITSLGGASAASQGIEAAFAGIAPQIEASFAPTDAALQAAEQGLTGLLTSLLGVGEEASTVTPELAQVGTQSEALATATSVAVPPEVALKNAIEALLSPSINMGEMLDSVLIPANTALGIAVDGLIAPLTQVQNEISALTPAEQLLSEALDSTFESVNSASVGIEKLAASEENLLKLAELVANSLIPANEELQLLGQYSQRAAEQLSLLGPAGEGLSALETVLAVTEVSGQNLANSLGQLTEELSSVGATASEAGSQVGSTSSQFQSSAAASSEWGAKLDSLLLNIGSLGEEVALVSGQLSLFSDNAATIAPALTTSEEAIAALRAQIQELAVGSTQAEFLASMFGEVGQAAASSVPGVAALTASSRQLEESEVEVAGVLDLLLHSLTVVSTAMEHLGFEAAGAVVQGLEEILGPLTSTGTLAPVLGESLNFVSNALGNVGPALSSVSSMLGGLTANLSGLQIGSNQTAGSLIELTAAAGGVASPLSAMNQQLQLLNNTGSGAEAAFVDIGSALGPIRVQLAGASQAAEMAAEAFDTLASSGIASFGQLASAANLETAALRNLSLVQEELVSAVQATAEATISTVTGIGQAAQQYELFAEATASASAPLANLAELQQAYATSNTNLTTSIAELESVKANSAATWVEYATAEQAVATASAEVQVAQEALQNEVASAQTVLTAALAEQESVKSNASATWVEVATAEQDVASATLQLVSAQAALGEQTAAVAEGNQVVAESEQQVATVSTETIAAVQALRAVLTQTGAISTQVSLALNDLASEEAANNSTTESFASALEVVNKALSKFNVELVGEVGSLRLVKAALDDTAQSTRKLGQDSEGATTKISALDGVLGNFAGRALASTAGVGQLGFSLGILGRTLAPLNQLFIAAFPLITIALAADIIQGLVDKFTKVDDGIRKVTLGFDDLAAGAQNSANSIELQNLKLEDQIAKLEGRPVTNRLKEALLEASIAADNLNKTLGDSIEKAIELMEKSNVGFFTSIFTGQEASSSFFNLDSDYEKALDAQRLYALAVQQRREAQLAFEKVDNDATQQAKVRAEQKVEIAREGVAIELSELQKGIDKRKALQEGSGAIPGVRGEGAVGKPRAEVDKAFVVEDTAALQLKNTYEALERAEKKEAEQAEKRKTDAVDSNAADARSRDKLLSEATTKATLDNAKTSLEVAKSSAEQILRTEEDKIKLETQQAIEGGATKEVAEQSAASKLLGVKQIYYQSLLVAQSDYITAELNAEQELGAISQRDLVGPARIAAQTASQQKIIDITRLGQDQLADIANKSGNAETEAKTRILHEQIDERTKSIQEMARLEIDNTKFTADEVKKTTETEVNDIKQKYATLNESVQANESLHTLSSREGYEARRNLIDNEQRETFAALEGEKSAFQDLQEAIALKQGLLPDNATADIERLQTEFDNLGKAINGVTKAQEALNAKMDESRQKSAINMWQQQMSDLTNFTGGAVGELNSFVAAFTTSNQTMAMDFYRMTLQLENLFFQMILKLIEETTVFKKIEGFVQDVLSKALSTIGLGPASKATKTALDETGATGGGAVKGAAGAAKTATATATDAQIVAQQVSTNAQLQALYQQDVAAYQAAQAQKVSGATVTKAAETSSAVSGQAAKTAATTTGEATRKGIEATSAATEVAKTGTKVTAHTIGEAAKTSSTIGGEAIRTGVGAVGVAKDVGRAGVKVTAHTAGEAAKTGATATGEASRNTLGLLGLAREIARVGMKVIHFLLGESGKTAAQTAGEATRAGEAATANASEAGSAAALAAANTLAFTSALFPPPIPEGLAGAAYAEGMGWAGLAFAEKGALVPQDMPIYAHAKEMVLPANISTGMQNIIASMSSGSIAKSPSVDDILSNTAKELLQPTRRETSRGSAGEGPLSASAKSATLSANREISISGTSTIDPSRGISETAREILQTTSRKLTADSISLLSTSTVTKNIASALSSGETLPTNQLIQAKAGQMIIPAPLVPGVKQAFVLAARGPAAEKGALLGADQMVFAHKDEMILPSKISNSFQSLFNSPTLNALSSSSGLATSKSFSSINSPAYRGDFNVENNTTNEAGGSPITFNYNQGPIHALDGDGVGHILAKNKGAVTKTVKDLIRRGNLGVKDFRK